MMPINKKLLQTFVCKLIVIGIISSKCIECWNLHESIASAYTSSNYDQLELNFSVLEGVPIGTLIGVIKSPNSSINIQPPYLIVPVPDSNHKINSSNRTFSSQYSSGSGGVDRDLNIDQFTGEIRSAVLLDREQRSFYSFITIPLTGNNIKVNIIIEDINDNSPQFPTDEIELEFPENSKPRDVKRTLPPARDIDLGLFGTQKYSIVSGNIGNAFRLLSHREKDDVLYLDLQVNGALDRETISSYILVIEALDGGQPQLTDQITVKITILDHNDCEPVFSRSHYYGNIAENVTLGTSILRVMATDNDHGENGLVKYFLHSLSTNFDININTGWIFVAKPLDFESKEIHELVVIARDSGAQPLETSAFVSIRVTDVNDNQPTVNLLFLTENAKPEIPENAKIGDLVARISVNDADASDPMQMQNSNIEFTNGLSVSISGGDNSFGITTQDNVIYLIVVTGPLDREKKSKYTIIIIVTDQGSPSLNTTSHFEVEITDVNDNPPYFENDSYETTVPETADIGTSVFRIKALDRDTHSIITYSFLDNSLASKWFAIDSRSGLITTQSQVDCETDPSPKLIILASDKNSPNTLTENGFSASTTLIVSISDVNDNEPIFDQSFYNISVREDETIGNCILKISASDQDCGLNAIVNYTFMNTITSISNPYKDFSIHPTTGQLCIAKQLDYEIRNSYDISVEATDRGGLSTTAMIKVQVIDTNDNYPTFYPKEYKVSVKENTVPLKKTRFSPNQSFSNSPLVIVAATDKDSSNHPFGIITYSIKDGNEDDTFEIEPKTGKIFLIKPINSKSRHLFQITVIARDGGNKESKVPAIVYISILPNGFHNSSPPAFTQNHYSFEVKENTKPGNTVGKVWAKTDTKHGIASNISYSIYSGDPEGYFSIDANAGIIRVESPQIDHEKYTFLLLNIQAEQGLPSGPFRYGHTQVNITILDENDNYPIFGATNLKIGVPENTYANNITILEAHAIDFDSNSFGQISYSLAYVDHNLTSNTLPLLPFSINSITGAITLNAALDYEHKNQYKLKAIATDGGNLKSQLLIEIIVQDANDNIPMFVGTLPEQKPNYKIDLLENVAINRQFFQVKATDADTGNNARLTYSLISIDNTKQLPFGIFPNNGMLYIKENLDRESVDYFELLVKVSDHGSPISLSSVAMIAIHVTDVNDNRPYWVEREYVFSISKNAFVGTLIGRIYANDSDLGNNASVRYYISDSQNSQLSCSQLNAKNNSSYRYNTSDGQISELSCFQLNAITGEIFLKSAIDRQLKDKYEFTAEVRDEGTPQQLCSEQKAIITINILDINDNRPSFDFEQNDKNAKSISLPGWILFLIVLLMLLTVVLLVSIIVIRLLQHQQQQIMSGHVRHMASHNIGSLLRKIGPMGGTSDGTMNGYHSHHTSTHYASPPAPPCYNDLTLSSSAVLGNPEGHSASSGRGSAEDEDEVEADLDDVDEEIRMINERGNYYADDDSTEEITTTAEYLARLGVMNHHEEEQEESSITFDEEEDDVLLDQLGNINSPPFNSIRSQERRNRVIPHTTNEWPSMCGSLSSIVHSEEELSGSYNWDYLQHWGPKYQPLLSVFAEIARLKGTVGETNESEDISTIDAQIQLDSGSTRSSSTRGSSTPSSHLHNHLVHNKLSTATLSPSYHTSLSSLAVTQNQLSINQTTGLTVDEEIQI